ncbi:MAG: symmetrical bis(5'-nucleosyl)-tetraphosphatase [Nitrospirota bacterium]|nr:symmetrical bis(5'-nucleosyl)-tetraphosphatase [Nitrospirota bacterium]
MATYAIGDIQGCFLALQRLLDRIQFSASTDRLWFVGDLVNRGPESLAVLRFVKQLGSVAVTVLGNHDLHLLAIHTGCASLHRKDTLHEILEAPDREELLNWLRYQPLMHRDGGFVLVHAGLLPQWSLEQATGLAQEVEDALQSDDYHLHMPEIYRCPNTGWDDTLPAPTRLGVITNVLTRMRVCTKDGEMDFSFKGHPDRAPDGFSPWYQVPTHHPRPDSIIFGHWSALGVLVTEHHLAIDGGCVWDRALVGVRLEDRTVFQVSCSS